MMTSLAKRGVKRALRAAGYDLSAYQPAGPADENPLSFVHQDMEEPFPDLFLRCHPYTMTSVERLYALFQAVNYIENEGIPGSIVECGVWRGGSSMMAALTLLAKGCSSRDLHLYDTYEGMSCPTDIDEKCDGSVDARAKYDETHDGSKTDWCYASLEEVKNNLTSTGYPAGRMHFVKGMVEETLIGDPPTGPIAILRLDTDFYESTKCELEVLYAQLVPGGVLIIDDYGTWKGARKAVDDFFDGMGVRPLLNKIDRTGRIGIKPE